VLRDREVPLAEAPLREEPPEPLLREAVDRLVFPLELELRALAERVLAERAVRVRDRDRVVRRRVLEAR